jgi:hypothetical protein
MTAGELLSELRALNIELDVAGDRLRYRPASACPDDLLAELRMLKPELVELLKDWPQVSLDYVERFQTPEARLYPFLGKSVQTPMGRGRLVQVIFPHAVVVLEETADRAVFLLWQEVKP